MTPSDLKQVLKDHLLWLNSDRKKGKRADLTNANLRNANLTNAYLKNAYLNNANLSHADLTHAYLDNANLTNANLTNANLNYAYLYKTNLTNTNLEGVKGIKVYKCHFIENNERKIKYFLDLQEAKKETSNFLKNKICSWSE